MSNPTYALYGPFVNGGAPGVNQTFLNALETFLVALNTLSTDPNVTASGGIATLLALMLNPTPVTVTGSVSGTASLYQYFQGSVKRALILFDNYKSGAAQTLALPVAFTKSAKVEVCESQAQTLEFLSGGSGGTAQTISVLSTVAATGGTQGPFSTIKSWSFGQVRTAFDTVRLTFTTTAASGYATIEGV